MKKHIILITLSLAVAVFSNAQCGSKSSNHVQKTSHHWNEQASDIVDVAASTDEFTTLVAAVKAADLASTLKSEGPFTVFAPLNTAFSKLPEGTVKSLLMPENKSKLAAILTYHVVAGEFNSTDIIAAINSSGGDFTVQTVNGGKLVASIVNGSVILTDENGGVSAVTRTDIKASNGVIHVIDTIVLPS